MRTESNIALDNFEERTEVRWGNHKYHANTSTTRAKLHVLLFRSKNYSFSNTHFLFSSISVHFVYSLFSAFRKCVLGSHSQIRQIFHLTLQKCMRQNLSTEKDRNEEPLWRAGVQWWVNRAERRETESLTSNQMQWSSAKTLGRLRSSLAS